MRNAITFLLVIVLGAGYVNAQQMAQYKFSPFVGTLIHPGGCQYWTSSNLSNWIITGGTPSWTALGPDNGSVSIWMANVASVLNWESFAGHYSFISGNTYFLRIGIATMNGGGAGCGNKLTVLAANGLSEVIPTECGGPLPIPTSSEIIGKFTSQTPITNKVYSVVYTPTSSFNQIFFYLDACGINEQLNITIDSVSITNCIYGEINYAHTIELVGGIQAGYSKITAGSGVATGVVKVDPDNTSVFVAAATNLLPNFVAHLKEGNYFLIETMPSCNNPCTFTGPACVVPGGTITLIPNASGGVWTSSNPAKATVDSDGVVHGISLTGIDFVTITYTIGECSYSYGIEVLNCTGGGKNANGNLAKDVEKDNVEIYPNPIADKIHITYPCSSSGQLEITLNDISGRLRYTESRTCNEGGNIQHTIDVAQLPPGVYFVELTLNGEHTIKKVVKL